MLIFKLFKNFILRPADAIDEITANDFSFKTPLLIYAVYLVLNSVFMILKPSGFPAEFAGWITEQRSFLFYLGNEAAWGSALILISCAFLTYFIRPASTLHTTSEGRLALAGRSVGKLKFAAKAALGLILLFVFFEMIRQSADGASVYVLFLGVSGYAAYATFKNINLFARILKLSLTLLAIYTAFIPFFIVSSAVLKIENLFILFQAGAVVWTLILMIKAVKIITGLTIGRILLCMIISSFYPVLIAYFLFKTGVISQDILFLLFF
ncbi:MAG: hypothetical protein HY746_03165 [Elusimicrobia bacterium]|nr:hypothetical protein [Elusimicrobiota bacterium]